MPEEATKKNPAKVLYLLHGLTDDHSIWTRRTSIERYVAGKNICVIMPTTQRGFYTDMKHGYKYWSYISEELPILMRNMLNISDKREDTFAAGLSMGGYGAVKLGLRQPERFRAVATLSGALDMAKHKDLLWEYEDVFGKEISPEDDIFVLLDSAKEKNTELPKIIQFCGTEDFLYEDNIAFRDKALKLGYDIDYFEGEGNHGWDYWDTNIVKVVDMICKL